MTQPPSSGWERCLTDRNPVARWALPARLREVSGLALSDDGRLWAHNDEAAVVGAFDPATGQVLGSFRLGPPTPRADFEGIAVAGSRLYLISSNGVLYAAPLPGPTVAEGRLAFEMIDTGIGRLCEVEGLSSDSSNGVLLVACKSPRTKELEGHVTVFRWSLAKKALASPDRITISSADLAKGRPGKGFHPSAIERDPRTGEWLLLASADNAFAVVDSTGRVVATGALKRSHPQPEGLALDAAGHLYVGDEGTKRPGTVTVYDCR